MTYNSTISVTYVSLGIKQFFVLSYLSFVYILRSIR